MRIYPAIDLYEKQVVRLYKGDYNQMTVYSNDPASVALSFKEAGAEYLHCVDLEVAKDGTTPNLAVVAEIVQFVRMMIRLANAIGKMSFLHCLGRFLTQMPF